MNSKATSTRVAALLAGILLIGGCGHQEALEGSIAFLAQPGTELNIRDLSQGTTQALPGHHEPRALSWAPGGRVLAVSTTVGIGKLDIGSGEWELLIPLTRDFLPLDTDWSPDGRWIAFTAERDFVTELFIASAESGRYRAIPGTRLGWSPSFAPDGSRLAFAQEILAGGPPTYKVMTIGLDGSDPVLVAEAIGSWDILGHTVAWSPDGTQIAFEDYRNESDQLMSVDVASGEVEGIGNGTSPSWAPDGDHLVVERLGPEGSSRPVVIDTQGEPIEALPEGFGPDWGP